MTHIWSLLKAGDIVDLIAPASGLEYDRMDRICEFIRSWGLIPRHASNLFSNASTHSSFLSNSDEARFEQLQHALYAKDSQAVWCIRGGYGCGRLLPKLSALTPPLLSKLVIGFSDITILHLFLNQCWGWETLHGEMLNHTEKPEFAKKMSMMKEVMFGTQSQFTQNDLIPLNSKAKAAVNIAGPLLVGNLSLLQTSVGTPWQADTKNKIVVIEEVGEKAYRIDRMLEHLRHANIWQHPSALVFGDMILEEGAELEKVAFVEAQFANSVNFPVYRTNGIGHGEVNPPLPMGGKGVISEDVLKYQFRTN